MNNKENTNLKEKNNILLNDNNVEDIFNLESSQDAIERLDNILKKLEIKSNQVEEKNYELRQKIDEIKSNF